MHLNHVPKRFSRYLRRVSPIALFVLCGLATLDAAGAEFEANRYGDVSDIPDTGSDERDVLPGPPVSGVELERMQRYVDEHAVRIGLVGTLVMPEGDIVDCVDREKQPALLQPGMKDHKLQLRPSFEAKMERPAATDDTWPLGDAAKQSYGTTAPSCPGGSVPIRRLTLEMLTRFSTLNDFLQKVPTHIGRGSDLFDDKPHHGPDDLHQYATAHNFVANWGGESVLNLWRPYTEQSTEFSLSQIWVVRGSDDDRETVEGGWQKYRQKYGDWDPRLFIYFTPDNYKDEGAGCYNLDCEAFIQVDDSVYIGGALAPTSVAEGTQKILKLLWYKDGPTGHWWLRYFDTWIGYYPRELFDDKGLRSQGERVSFGGEIIDDRAENRHTRTDMGSGRWPWQGFGLAAYQRSVRYVDTNNFYRQATGMSTHVTDPACYDIELHSSVGAWEQHFYFGGPGYSSLCL
ncbi:neprosin family prolyl endopeptidase [Lysobacter sp. CA199]|uniref:neprosin family prolyl endopeptidase n=1 Tax=Lysobacter sp. CA199 TaxID=3455608 RepID=UPI003F8D38CB